MALSLAVGRILPIWGFDKWRADRISWKLVEEVSAQTEDRVVQQQTKQPSKRGLVIALFILLFLLFSLGVMIVFVRERTTFFGRAFGPSTRLEEVAVENSYLFASPLSARADGKEKIRVTIFVLESQGRGVYGKPVFLGEDERLEITPIQAVTDNLGRAIFDISATAPAEYFIEARVGNQLLPQRLRLNFR